MHKCSGKKCKSLGTILGKSPKRVPRKVLGRILQNILGMFPARFSDNSRFLLKWLSNHPGMVLESFRDGTLILLRLFLSLSGVFPESFTYVS